MHKPQCTTQLPTIVCLNLQSRLKQNYTQACFLIPFSVFLHGGTLVNPLQASWLQGIGQCGCQRNCFIFIFLFKRQQRLSPASLFILASPDYYFIKMSTFDPVVAVNQSKTLNFFFFLERIFSQLEALLQGHADCIIILWIIIYAVICDLQNHAWDLDSWPCLFL